MTKKRNQPGRAYFVVSVPAGRARQFQGEAFGWTNRRLEKIGQKKLTVFSSKAELATEMFKPVFAKKLKEVAARQGVKVITRRGS